MISRAGCSTSAPACAARPRRAVAAAPHSARSAARQAQPARCCGAPAPPRSARGAAAVRRRCRWRTAAQPAEAGSAPAAADASDAPPLLRAQVPAGELLVRPIQQSDVRGAAVLLTRAFVNSQEAVSLDEAMGYMAKQLASPELGVTLVARLVPTDASLLPKGQASRLVGTVRLAFDLADASTSDGLERLRALPPDSAYLSNMAVDPKLRRQGIARAMLQACDAAAAAGPSTSGGSGGGRSAIYLHVREGDAPAAGLYAGYGYQEVEKEAGAGGGLFGFGRAQRRPRVLMRRTVGGGGGSS